jgi:hypothetical protein
MDGQDRRTWIKARQREDLPVFAEGIAYGSDRIALCDGRYKLIARRDGRPLRFFDLQEDPGERHNAVAEVDSLPFASAMRDSLVSWSDRLLRDAPQETDTQELSDRMRKGLRSLGYVQ